MIYWFAYKRGLWIIAWTQSILALWGLPSYYLYPLSFTLIISLSNPISSHCKASLLFSVLFLSAWKFRSLNFNIFQGSMNISCLRSNELILPQVNRRTDMNGGFPSCWYFRRGRGLEYFEIWEGDVQRINRLTTGHIFEYNKSKLY